MEKNKKVNPTLEKYKKQFKEIKPINFLFLLIAGIVNAFGVTLFLYPVQLYDSGISGLSMLLDKVTPPYLTISIFLIVINFPIFIFGMKKQGLAFTIYSIFTIGIYSLFSFLFTQVFFDVSTSSPIAGNDVLLCALFGGAISGIGSGLTIRFGGAIDGIDVLSVVFAKKIGLSIGTFVMIFNFVLYVVCGFIFRDWTLPLYSIVTYFIGSKTVDFIVEDFDRSKCAMIVTTKASIITDLLCENFGSSGTIINAIGGYSKTDKQIVYFIVNRFQLNKLKRLVLSADKNAFISIQDVSDVTKKIDL